MEYRHEIKFLVSDSQLELLRYRIAPLMKQDLNQTGSYYMIRSLYFDDLQDNCLRENLDGDDRRNKYRIRVYNNDFGYIRLEKKSKIRAMTKKESVLISSAECDAFMRERVIRIQEEFSDKKKCLFAEMQLKALRPKSIVEYERTAYIFRVGNVRITFDRNICGSLESKDFLREKICSVPILPSGIHILEVKFDELLPGFIYSALQIDALQVAAFSKYSYSRMQGGSL